MIENAAENPAEPPEVAGVRNVLNPASIDPDALARMLGLSAALVRRHMDEGAPVNPDGTVNVVHYAAWLNTPAPAAAPGCTDQANEESDGGSTD